MQGSRKRGQRRTSEEARNLVQFSSLWPLSSLELTALSLPCVQKVLLTFENDSFRRSKAWPIFKVSDSSPKFCITEGSSFSLKKICQCCISFYHRWLCICEKPQTSSLWEEKSVKPVLAGEKTNSLSNDEAKTSWFQLEAQTWRQHPSLICTEGLLLSQKWLYRATLQSKENSLPWRLTDDQPQYLLVQSQEHAEFQVSRRI